MPDEPLHIETDIELKLLSAHQDWLAEQHKGMLQWMRAMDVQITILNFGILGLSAAICFLGYRLTRLEATVDTSHRRIAGEDRGTHQVFDHGVVAYRTG